MPFLSPSQQCINTEGSRALTAIGETFLIHYWTREERLASPSMKAVLFQYPCGNRYHFSTLINCFIDYCFVLYILLFESVENIAFPVKVAVNLMLNSWWLTCACAVEDQLIVGIIGNDSGAVMQFRLAPAYALYLVLRSCVSSATEPDSGGFQHDKHVSLLASKMAQYLHQIIEVDFVFCLV